MKEKQTPRDHEGQPPSDEPKETPKQLEQKADEQQGEADHAPVRFGG